MRYIETPIYSFEDILKNDTLKEKVLKKYSDINTDYDWWDFIVDDFKNNDIFEVNNVYFSGFYSQGDGAMFEGKVKDFSKFIDNPRILKLYKKDLIYIYCSFKHSGHYYHEKSYYCHFEYELYKDSNYNNSYIEKYLYNLEDKIRDYYETLCKELYKTLEDNYDYYTSEEAILETLETNDYEYDSEGNIA